jgi:hypothetical protein
MKTLRILKLVLEGERYKRTLNIDKPLTIIKGDGYSGKSLFLKLIYYCLGSKNDLIDLTIQKELAQYCNEVYLEIGINGNIYTINRKILNEKNTIFIYLCQYVEHVEYSPWKKSVEEYMDFLVDELGIVFHSILKKRPGSKDLSDERITFRDLMRYIFIRQNELGTNHFLENLNPFLVGKNKEVFKIINDLIVPDIEEIDKDIQIKQNELNRLESMNKGMGEYLSKRDASILAALINNRNRIDKDIQELKAQKNNIIYGHKNTSDDIYFQLKKDIAEINGSIVHDEKEKNNLIISINNKKVLLEDYNGESEKLKATLEAMKKIKIINHQSQCPLCNSFVSVLSEEEENCDDVENVIEQLKNKIETLIRLSNEEINKVTQLDIELRKSNEKKEIYLDAMHEYQGNMDVPYLSEIESINSIIKAYTDDKHKITSLIDIHNDVDNNLVSLERLKTELIKLRKRKDELTQLTIRQEITMENLNNKYRSLMKRFNFTDIEPKECYISKENYMPYYSGSSVMKHNSGCLLLCMQIAYLGAILELNQEEENNCHPSLLMLDTVSNNIGTDKNEDDSVDPKTYSEIYKYLSELSLNNQIFIIDNTPPEINVEHTEFFFHRVNPSEKLRGLIDMTKNEKAGI